MLRTKQPDHFTRAVEAVESIAASLDQISETLFEIQKQGEQARHDTAENS